MAGLIWGVVAVGSPECRWGILPIVLVVYRGLHMLHEATGSRHWLVGEVWERRKRRIYPASADSHRLNMVAVL